MSEVFVVSALVNRTVDIAANLIISEVSDLSWLSEDINWLKSQLRHMQSYLEDAEAKKVTNPKVETLLKDICNLAYDVEDILDTYLPKIEFHRTLGLIKRAATKPFYYLTCTGFAREIEKIKRRVQEIEANRINYNIESTGSSGGVEGTSGSYVDPRTTALHVDEPIVVGFDKDIEELRKLLGNEEEEFCAVSIVGMAGLGKTTLAKKVFGFVRDRYACSASVSVSQDPNVKSLLQDIAKQVGMDERQEENIEADLYSFLEKKRYVLFLDDIGHTVTWDKLKVSFPFAKRSRIIITSRYDDVGSYISGRDSLLHKLQPFDFQTSWELLSKSIVPSLEKTNQGLDDSDLGDIGKKIVERCGGVPFAIVLTVGILRERGTSEMAWRGVLKSMGQVTDDKCSEILALSYKDLPTLLKPCFLYLGLFPKDYEMKACRVIRMWMAENFIKGIGKLEPEDVGDNYLNTLDARNLIQVISRKYDGRIKRFRIHHLLRDLCVNVGKEINFLHIITNDSVESRSGSIKTRRLGIQNVDVDSLVNSNIEAHKVRALFIFGTEEKSIAVEQVEKILARFKLLRVLNFGVPTSSELVNINNFRLLENLPLLKNLSLLKYLQFSAGGFAVIPRIISHETLQTVDYGMSLFPNYIPISMWKIKQLRHVSLQVWGDTRTLNTHELCLPNLQTLRAFVYHLDLSWLNKFNNLRKLRLGCVNGETIDVLCGESEPMSKKLETLYLESFRGAVTSVIDLSKYSQLMKLTIVMEIRKLPNPRNFPPNIVKLRLEKTGLIKDPMQVLKKLLNLKILILDSQSYLGATLDYSGLGSFPRLEVLLLRSLMELLELVDGDEGRLPPNLRQVIIKGCRKSPRVPESLEPFVTRSLRAWDTTG